MSTILEDFSNGETGYVVHLNLVVDAIEELQSLTAEQESFADVLEALYGGLFGTGNPTRIGLDSYTYTYLGAVLTVSAGYLYLPDDQKCVTNATDTDIDLTGLGAHTFYVHVNSTTGVPFADLSNATPYIASVVFNGTAITSYADVAMSTPGINDWVNIEDGAIWSPTYNTLGNRLNAIEASAANLRTVVFSSTTYALSETEGLQQNGLVLTGTPGGAATLTVPDLIRSYTIFNNTGEVVTVEAGSTPADTVDIPLGHYALVYTNGDDDVLPVFVAEMTATPNGSGTGGGGGSGGASSDYSIMLFQPAQQTANALMYRMVFPHTVTFPANLPGSYATSVIGALASSTFTIKKDGSSVGTLNYAAGQSNGIFTFASEQTFTEGVNVFSLHGPAVVDDNLSDISISFRGIKQTALSYVLQVFMPTVLTDEQLLFRAKPTNTFSIAEDASGSYAIAVTAATAEAVFSLQKNAVEFGTITFAAAGSTGTFVAALETSFNQGSDIISIVGPATADATLAGVSISLLGVREA